MQLTTSGTVHLDVSPTGTGASIGTDSLEVISTCPYGYTLSITGPADSTLYKDGNKANNAASQTIPASTGTLLNPVSILGDNLGTWGYTTSAGATTSSNFIGLTSTANALITKDSASGDGSTTESDTIPVYYGVSVSNSHDPGLYTLAESPTGPRDNIITYNLTTPATCLPEYAFLDTGSSVNDKFSRLANDSSNATALVRSDTLPADFTPNAINTISDDFSEAPIYAWYDPNDTTIYYYSGATYIIMNQDSSSLFYNMQYLSELSTISSWGTSDVTNMSNMFSGTAQYASTFSLDLSDWNTSNVTDMSDMFSNAARTATTWSVTIPKTNNGTATGPIANTTTELYGIDISVYGYTYSDKPFTLAD